MCIVFKKHGGFSSYLLPPLSPLFLLSPLPPPQKTTPELGPLPHKGKTRTLYIHRERERAPLKKKKLFMKRDEFWWVSMPIQLMVSILRSLGTPEAFSFVCVVKWELVTEEWKCALKSVCSAVTFAKSISIVFIRLRWKKGEAFTITVGLGSRDLKNVGSFQPQSLPSIR